MCVWTAQAWTDCMSTLLEKRSKNDPISVIPWTCGRSGLQGVSKGCQRGAPVDPNLSRGSPKRAQRVAKGAQRVPKGHPSVPKGCPKVPKVAQRVFNGWPRAPQRCPREPKGCPRYAQRPRGVKIGAQTAIIHHIRYQQMTKNITSLACLALSLFLSPSISLSL